MPKRLAVLGVAVALTAAACTAAAAPALDTGKGTRFVPQVVDWAQNVGMSPAVAVDGQGNPSVAYLGFPAVVKSGQIPETRPVTAPPVPNVLFARQSSGVWTTGGVAQPIVAAGPLVGVDTLTTKPPSSSGGGTTPIATARVAVAEDSGGNTQVAWIDSKGIEYSAESSGTFGKPELVRSGPASGVSIAVDRNGKPWIAFLMRGGLMVSTLQGRRWTIARVGPAGSTAACAATSTAAAVDPSGSPVIAYSVGGSPAVATLGASSAVATSWTSQVVSRGDCGIGISIAVDQAANIQVAYYTASGSVVRAESGPEGWGVERIASNSSAAGGHAGWTTSTAVDSKGTVYLAWYDPASDSVRLGSDAAGAFRTIDTPGTGGGYSPSVAVAADGSNAYLAWYDHVNQNLMVGTYGANTSLVLAAQSPTSGAQGPSTGPSQAPTCTKPAVTVKVVAPAGAISKGFQPSKLTVPAGKCFAIAFSNQDPGVPHNVAVYTDSSATTSIAIGATITGPASSTVVVPALSKGSYFFRCDVHPTLMTGTITAG